MNALDVSLAYFLLCCEDSASQSVLVPLPTRPHTRRKPSLDHTAGVTLGGTLYHRREAARWDLVNKGSAMGAGVGAGRGIGLLPATEVCAALLMLCWLCCWPDDSNSDTTPDNPWKPVVIEPGTRHRSGEFFSRRMGSSAVSLHLPSTSGSSKQPLSAHRSHEEIRSRRKSHHETPTTSETRYHSAPSVIDEVIHRRDWERSTKELYIPLKPENECLPGSSPSLDKAPYAEPESSSVEEYLKPETKSPKVCKKHHTNIKSSKKCKESNNDDIKDTDATEVSPAPSNFYIGDTNEESSALNLASTSNYEDFIEYERLAEERNRSIYKAKEAKQSINESIRLKEMPKKGLVPLEEDEVSRYEFLLVDDIDMIDRSGAEHHSIESRMSFARPYPPPSVETVGYDGGACYLAEVGSVSELRARATLSPHVVVPTSLRARHASDGDILAPPQRPESGAFSESDLDLDLELEELEGEERPPDYDDIQQYASPKKKETAI